MNDSTGDIATCSGPNLHWWTVNGDLFAEQMISTDERKGILACLFFEGVGHEWIAKDLLFTAHKEGVVRVKIVSFNSDDRYGVDTCAKQPKQANLLGN